MGADWYYVHTDAENTIMSMCSFFLTINPTVDFWKPAVSDFWHICLIEVLSSFTKSGSSRTVLCFFLCTAAMWVARLMWDQSFNSKNVIDLRIKDIFIPRPPFSEDPNKLWCKMDKINKNRIKYLRYLSTLGKKHSPNSSLYCYKPHTLYKRCRCHSLVC